MKKLSDKDLQKFVDNLDEMIELKLKQVELYKELKQAVLYEHSDYILQAMKHSMTVQPSYALFDKDRNWLKGGSVNTIIAYIKSRKINLNKICIHMNAEKIKKDKQWHIFTENYKEIEE
jgi:coenzyme F420-reducing hydrogenase alpha subunit